ncbi:archaetidylserine decarboxylase [Solemya velum gill symbiont]|uniref:archaetidylserine decarboxylase n=1 Tax=Solemya velum gill symbiont TaxID=2340 RepID=UPI000997BE47|nr:archaetidylserine decarboxylase [Solemya velum gill symbiont]OOY53194.1 phosphatidylserine decarboxylase [Solemya velum gill symbiont]OOY57162.1 phosphatidylserine decarboxylase [Solemya velum gill symbiont]OOY58348.1 phosphatidylserine decarboxylase [Solemya velum gill symbiont]OOY61996.1 phosphatidylserine decarboxylase [Solemya velum gill symbiont]OOY63476.1 phosphatidylserine decarboxylase [Solemya velum gill symbiont]
MGLPVIQTGDKAPLGKRLFILLQQLIPQHFLSSLMYALARSEIGFIKNSVIRIVNWMFDINMQDAVVKDPLAYPSFNAFFTRALEPASRPLDSNSTTIISPVDGAVSQAGHIESGLLFQAKGIHYSITALLGGDAETAKRFSDGDFATIYLSPRDYHRIHMPVDGKLSSMTHVPGELFSVNETTTSLIPGLFARNERIINLFETPAGPMALIMVGAIFVGSMDTVWAGTVTPSSKRISHQEYLDQPHAEISLEKGEEMGRFNMGSTVILLFGKNQVNLDGMIAAGREVKMGERIGTRIQA